MTAGGALATGFQRSRAAPLRPGAHSCVSSFSFVGNALPNLPLPPVIWEDDDSGIVAAMTDTGTPATRMTILSLTFFRRHREQDSADRLDRESSAEATKVLRRLEGMLVESPTTNEMPVPTGSPVDLGSAPPSNDEPADASLMPESTAARDSSVVFVMAPPEGDEVQPETSDPETSEEDVEVRLMAALDNARSEREARRLAEQERDRLQHESRRQLDRLEAELGDAVERGQTEVVLRRSAEIELERVQEESSQRVAEMEARLEGLAADLSKATRKTKATVSTTAAAAEVTTTTIKVKGATTARKPRTARKPAAAARKKRSATKTAPAHKPKTVKTATVGTKRKSIAGKVPATRR